MVRAMTYPMRSLPTYAIRWVCFCPLAMCLFVPLAAPRGVGAAEDNAAGPPRRVARQIATLNNKRINESSGLACSHRFRDLLYTHNDSGDRPRIYAISTGGADEGTFELAKTAALDWEDMCSFQMGGKSYLLVGDIGDNFKLRPTVTLYLAEEPATKAARGNVQRIEDWKRLDVKLNGGAVDLEGLAVDAPGRTVLLATKEFWKNDAGARKHRCRIFFFAFPREIPKGPITARFLCDVSTPSMVTAMDVSSSGDRALLLTYRDLVEFVRRPTPIGDLEPWEDAFKRGGQVITVARQAQPEAACYGPDGRTIYITSEGVPTPLLKVDGE